MQQRIKQLIFTLIVSISLISAAGAGLLDGLVGYWPLDEATGQTASDTSGNGNHATLAGKGLTWKPKGGKEKVAVRWNLMGADLPPKMTREQIISTGFPPLPFLSG